MWCAGKTPLLFLLSVPTANLWLLRSRSHGSGSWHR
jgi:hypothetical protein